MQTKKTAPTLQNGYQNDFSSVLSEFSQPGLAISEIRRTIVDIFGLSLLTDL